MSSPQESVYRCTVLLSGPFERTFDYLVEKDIPVGSIVEVPFGKRTEYGIVWPQSPDPKLSLQQLKSIQKETPYKISIGLVKMLSWMSRYNLIPLGQLIKLVFAGVDPQSRFRTSKIDFRTGHLPADFLLSPQQQKAFADISAQLQEHKPTLLDGITGSGKTEVYLKLIQQALQNGQQVLVMLPEIALTPDWGNRFRSRIGTDCYIWHSQVGMSLKKAIWHHALSGEPCVVVGARSSLFLPFTKLGLIVVDEEHDASFKQDETPVYHARDSAIVRAHHEKIPIILSTATASLETFWNVAKGKYNTACLAQRFAQAQRPVIDTCDLRTCERHANNQDIVMAQTVIDNLQENLSRGEQSLLFLNRRGYAPMAICSGCGNKRGCPRCSTLLVEHRKTHKLLCHQCGWTESVASTCRICGAQGLIPVGSGVERVFDMITHVLPQARTAIVSSDHIPQGHDLVEFLQQVQNKEFDILIGTQVLAKGHNFPHLTFVGILDADAILNAGAGLDMRAAERTFQLIEQVSGRAGRAEKPGRVLLQTFQPQHPVIQALVQQDRNTFYELELDQRRAAHMPPFGRLIALIISGTNQDKVRMFAMKMKERAPLTNEVKLFGPAPAPIEKIRSHYRWRFLLHSSRIFDLSGYTMSWLASLQIPRDIRLKVDVDPYNFN